MATHIATLNIAAPVVAFAWGRLAGGDPRLARLVIPAGIVQLALFLGWHSPPAVAWTAAHGAGAAAMHVSLAAAALAFWRAVFEAAGCRPLATIGPLLVTGKIFCLLGVLLAFAPRPIYPRHGLAPELLVADQQLAGLMMLVACPLTYLLAAVVIAARWLAEVDRRSAPSGA